MIVPDAPPSFGAVWGHDDWDLVRLSEEHGVLAVPPGDTVRVGDRVAIVPNHICPAINLASALTVVEGGARARPVAGGRARHGAVVSPRTAPAAPSGCDHGRGMPAGAR